MDCGCPIRFVKLFPNMTKEPLEFAGKSPRTRETVETRPRRLGELKHVSRFLTNAATAFRNWMIGGPAIPPAPPEQVCFAFEDQWAGLARSTARANSQSQSLNRFK